MVTAISSGHGVSGIVTVGDKNASIALRIPEQSSASPTETSRQSWMSRRKAPSPGEVGKLLARLERRIALLIMPGGQVHIWALPSGTRFARRVSGAPANQPRYIAKLVREWVDSQNEGAPDPQVPLMREEPGAAGKSGGRSTRWWVYSAVGAAVTVGAVIILADQFADDRQRIELTLP